MEFDLTCSAKELCEERLPLGRPKILRALRGRHLVRFYEA